MQKLDNSIPSIFEKINEKRFTYSLPVNFKELVSIKHLLLFMLKVTNLYSVHLFNKIITINN